MAKKNQESNKIIALSCPKCGKSEFTVEVNMDMVNMYKTGIEFKLNMTCKTCQSIYYYNNINGIWEISPLGDNPYVNK